MKKFPSCGRSWRCEREFPRALLILAPRKPEQFDNAAAFVAESGRKMLRRRDLTLNGDGNSALAEPGNVLLLDSIGELAGLYRLADAVFVGGSLVPSGGHNILEPAAFGKVPIYGPSMENFREMAAKFLAANAAYAGERVPKSWVLRGEVCCAILSARRDMGACARETCGSKSRRDRARFGTHRAHRRFREERTVKRSAGWLRLLWPLSLVYSAIVRAKAWCYARGHIPQHVNCRER